MMQKSPSNIALNAFPENNEFDRRVSLP